MFDMFADCYNLKFLKAPNFGFTNLKNAQGLFYKNEKLIYLDLPNFEFPNITTVLSMFRYCSSIVFINLYSMKIKEGTNITTLFDSVYGNLKICINDENTRNILNEYNDKFNCSHICFEENIKICLKDNRCVTNCDECDFKYEYNRLCQENCPSNTIIIENEQKFFCLNKKPDGYYFDSHSNTYKKCYETCKSCDRAGNVENNNCTECKTTNYIHYNGTKYNFLYEFKKNDYKNCYFKCPDEYPILDGMEC